MSKYEFTYEYFMNTDDGLQLSVHKRIEEALKLLENEGDYIEFPDGVKCQNKAEVSNAIKKKRNASLNPDKNFFLTNKKSFYE